MAKILKVQNTTDKLRIMTQDCESIREQEYLTRSPRPSDPIVGSLCRTFRYSFCVHTLYCLLIPKTKLRQERRVEYKRHNFLQHFAKYDFSRHSEIRTVSSKIETKVKSFFVILFLFIKSVKNPIKQVKGTVIDR